MLHSIMNEYYFYQFTQGADKELSTEVASSLPPPSSLISVCLDLSSPFAAPLFSLPFHLPSLPSFLLFGFSCMLHTLITSFFYNQSPPPDYRERCVM